MSAYSRFIPFHAHQAMPKKLRQTHRSLSHTARRPCSARAAPPTATLHAGAMLAARGPVVSEQHNTAHAHLTAQAHCSAPLPATDFLRTQLAAGSPATSKCEQSKQGKHSEEVEGGKEKELDMSASRDCTALYFGGAAGAV